MLVGSTWPSGVSARNLAHWSQMFHTANGILMYDFGQNCSESWTQQPFQESCNQAKYGFDTPLQYDLRKVSAPAALFEGTDDLMATQPDSKVLQATWNSTVLFKKVYPKVAHMDFVWARKPVMKQDIINTLWGAADKVV